MRMDSEVAVLDRIGVEHQVLDSGCCGMAGAFGYLDGAPYAVSIGAAERVLLPAVREADAETLIVADGYSCREQVEQLAARRASNLAEILEMALDREVS